MSVDAFGDAGPVETVLTYLLVAFVFGIVNAVVGTLIRIVAIPLYVLTLGLISFVVNGVLLLIVAGGVHRAGLRPVGGVLRLGHRRCLRARGVLLAGRTRRPPGARRSRSRLTDGRRVRTPAAP
ncbi:phage holin family protein [Curtobacterium sp. MCJR17_043]|uniref:phage holin family protein n=1 Tax=Curtobacterium sp. MCJR17_043 TaxID=2175660 RepID=UPI0032E91054